MIRQPPLGGLMVSMSYIVEEIGLPPAPPPAVIKAYYQVFEHGIFLYMRLPRAYCRDQWFVLYYDDERSQYWSFVNPVSLLGTEALPYRANGHRPPPGYSLPAVGFGSVWSYMKEMVGWAMGPVKSYVFAYDAPPCHDPYAPPPSLPGPDGLRFFFNADRTWDLDVDDEMLTP